MSNSKSEFMVDWTCPLCTYINPAADYVCCVCGARKGSSTRRGRGRAQQLDQIVAQQIQGEITLGRNEVPTDKSGDDSRPTTPNKKATSIPANTTKSPKASKPAKQPAKKQNSTTASKKSTKPAKKKDKKPEKPKRKLPPKHENLDILNAQSITITVNGKTVTFQRFVEKVGAANVRISHAENNNNKPEIKSTEKTPTASAKSSATNTPTKKRTATELTRTGSASSNKSSNEKSPRAAGTTKSKLAETGSKRTRR